MGVISFLLALVSLLTGVFILIHLPQLSWIFTTELVVIVLLLLLCLAAVKALKSVKSAKLLMQLFFLCSTANAVFIYLTTEVRSLSVLFLAAVSLAGLFLSLSGKKERKKEKLRQKEAEVAEQPAEEKPSRKRKAKKR